MQYFKKVFVLAGVTFVIVMISGIGTSFAWDFYAYEIADHAEAVYDPNINPNYRAQCAVFVVDVLEALTGLRSYGWTSQAGYESGLQNTYNAIEVSLSGVERGDIVTITHKEPGYWVPHVAIVSEYTDGNLFITESNVPGCYECVRVHNNASWMFKWSSLRFWRVGKSKNEQPTPTPKGCTDPNATNYDVNAVVDNGSCQYPAFNEYAGIPAESLSNHYYYSLMDSRGGEDGLYTWTVIGNPSATEPAHVTIKIHCEDGEISETYTLEPGEREAPKFSGCRGGPVEVISDMNIYTTQRTVIDGAFSEYAGIPVERLSNHYYYSLMDSRGGDEELHTWTLVTNPSSTETAHVTITFTSEETGDMITESYSIEPGGHEYPRFKGQRGSLIEVKSDIDVLTTQRTSINGAFNEYAGIPAESLTNHYYYSLMDSRGGDQELRTWTLVTNPSTTETANVTIKFTDEETGDMITESYAIEPGGHEYPRFNGKRGSLIEVKSDIDVLTTQRTSINGAFNEYAGIPAENLTNHYYYAWMDSDSRNKKNTWTLVTNPSTTETAHVTIKIAGNIIGTYNLEPGEHEYPRFDGLKGGPVEVESDIAVLTTQRVSMNSEHVAIPSRTYYYSLMDSRGGNEGLQTWTLITNPSKTETAHVTIQIADDLVGAYVLEPGTHEYPRFDGKRGGPVVVESDIDILTTQRTSIDGAFNEYAGIPAESLTNHYYYSLMDSRDGEKDLHTWTLVTNPSATETAHVTITFTSEETGDRITESYIIEPGGHAYPRFDGKRGGPIEVKSDIAVLTTQRTSIDGAFNEYAGIPAESLTNHYYYSLMDSRGGDEDLYTWTLVTNPSATETAHVVVKVAGEVFGIYDLSPGEQVKPRFDHLRGGPIEVLSDKTIYTTQRTLIDGAFNEYAGISVYDHATIMFSGNINSSGGNVALASGKASVTFPPDAVSQSLVVTVTQLDDALVPTSNSHDVRIGHAYELTALNEYGDDVTQFDRAVAVALRYEKNTVKSVNEFLLTIKFYDEHLKTWVELPSNVDLVNYFVTAQTNHFTTFAIFAPEAIEPPPILTPTVSPSTVPEPTTFLLFGMGLVGVLMLLKRRR